MDFQTQNNSSQNDAFSHRERYAHRHDVMQRVIEGAGSLLTSLLAIRFVFSLLGANPTNGFASFIYNFTAPFTAPFSNLFSYDHPSLGIATFEGYTLVAIAVYGLATLSLAKLVAITRY